MARRYDIESGNALPGDSPLVHLGVESARRGFVRKVYSLVATQLVATTLIAAPIATASDKWLGTHQGLLVFSLIGFLVLGLSMCCCRNLLRQYPTNLVILAAFTVLEAVSVGFVCANYQIQSVVYCLGATAAIAAGLTFFAVTTKTDVTNLGGYLNAAALGLFVFGLLGLIMKAPLMTLLYAICGAVLASGYIVYDTQLIVGGKHDQQFTIDDYVPAAICIYLDMVQLFLHLLRIFGEERREQR